MFRVYPPPARAPLRPRDLLALWPFLAGCAAGWVAYWVIGFVVCEVLINGRLEVRWKPPPPAAGAATKGKTGPGRAAKQTPGPVLRDTP